MSYCRFNVIPILADILSDSVKEKVTRIILAVFRVRISKNNILKNKPSVIWNYTYITLPAYFLIYYYIFFYITEFNRESRRRASR